MDLLSIMLKTLTASAALDPIAEKTGLSKKQLGTIIGIAVPMIMKSMTKNAASNEGASSLLGALSAHKTEKPVAAQVKDADEEDGGKILGHIFGTKKEEAEKEIAKESGLDAKDVAKVMAILAPVVLSSVSSATAQAGKKKQQGIDLSDGLDLGDVMGMLAGAQQKEEEPSMVEGLLGSLLGGQKKQDNTVNGTELLGSLLSMMK